MNNIEDFVNRLVEEKGFSEKDPEVLQEIKNDLMERVENRVNAMILSMLGEEEIGAFEKVLNNDTSENIQKFIKNHIPNIEEKVAQELMAFRAIYLG